MDTLPRPATVAGRASRTRAEVLRTLGTVQSMWTMPQLVTTLAIDADSIESALIELEHQELVKKITFVAGIFYRLTARGQDASAALGQMELLNG